MLSLPPPITSRNNARVKALRASLSGEARRPGDLLGLEGEHLVKEATLAGFSFETVFLREGNEGWIDRVGWPEEVRTAHWAVLSRDVFDAAMSTASPQGIAATWAIQEVGSNDSRSSVLILEGLQDPGNFGTLIRSADAFGTRKIMVTPETVNEWNPKVVRAASGSIFRVRVTRLPLEEIVMQLRSEGVRVFAAVAGFVSTPELGESLLAAPNGVLTGRIANALAPEADRYRGESSMSSQADPKGYPASLSYDTDFLNPCAIMIGNEGAGLSAKARSLADEQVQIPCRVESLNAAVAGSVLMYELMRQQPLRRWAQRHGLRP